MLLRAFNQLKAHNLSKQSAVWSPAACYLKMNWKKADLVIDLLASPHWMISCAWIECLMKHILATLPLLIKLDLKEMPFICCSWKGSN